MMNKFFERWDIILVMVVAASLFGMMLAWSFPQYNPLDSGEEATMEQEMEEMEEDFENMDMEDSEEDFEAMEEDLDELDEELNNSQ